jgi:hypothetical protein
MDTKKWLMAISVGIVGALTVSHATFAEPAQHRYNADRDYQRRYPTEVRHNLNPFENEKADLRRGRIEMRRERRDLRRAIRWDASPEEIARERREFRNRLREYRDDRRDLRRYWRNYRWYRDPDDRGYWYSPYRYGWYNDNRGWWNGNHYGWWGYNPYDRHRHGLGPYNWRRR